MGHRYVDLRGCRCRRLSDAFRCRLQGQAAGRAYKEHGDEVVRNTYGVDSTPTIEAMRPDLIVIGVDEAARDYYAQTAFTHQ